jgi:hypothetical protein
MCSFAVPQTGDPWTHNGEVKENSIASGLPLTYQRMFEEGDLDQFKKVGLKKRESKSPNASRFLVSSYNKSNPLVDQAATLAYSKV